MNVSVTIADLEEGLRVQTSHIVSMFITFTQVGHINDTTVSA